MAHSRGRGKSIDTVHWTLGSFTVAALATGQTSALTLLSAQHLPETLLRIRGEWMAYVDATQAPGNATSVTAGMIQVPEGTGTTELWSPVSDGDAPWIWWDTFCLGYEEYVTDVIDSPGITSARRVIDSKAMRKLRNTEIQVVVQTATIIGSGMATNTFGQVRVLAGS